MSGVPARITRKAPASKAANKPAAPKSQPETPAEVNGSGDSLDIVRKTLAETEESQVDSPAGEQDIPASTPQQPTQAPVLYTPPSFAAPVAQPQAPANGWPPPSVDGWQQAPTSAPPFASAGGFVATPPPVVQFQVRTKTDVFSLRIPEDLKRWLNQRAKLDAALYNLPDGALPAQQGACLAANYHECLRMAVLAVHGFDIGPKAADEGPAEEGAAGQ